jgi:hypothetical protein
LVDQLDLEKNSFLRKISLGPVYLFGNGSPRTSDWLVIILSRISSSSVEKVTVIIHMNEPKEMAEFDLQAIRHLFIGGNRFLASTKLHFLIRGEISRKEASRALVRDLSDLKKLGRLQCSVEFWKAGASRLY